MKHLSIARLFIFLGAGALLADVAPSRCSKSARVSAPIAAVHADSVPASGIVQ